MVIFFGDVWTAPQVAAEGGHLEAVERLLVANANVNAPGSPGGGTAPQVAAKGSHLDIVGYLLRMQTSMLQLLSKVV